MLKFLFKAKLIQAQVPDNREPVEMQIILPDKTSWIISNYQVPIREILLELGFAPSGVIVIKNGSVVPDDLIAEDDDEIRIIKIAHGG